MCNIHQLSSPGGFIQGAAGYSCRTTWPKVQPTSNSTANRVYLLLLVVQKSQGQPPGMVLKNLSLKKMVDRINWSTDHSWWVNAGFRTNHQQYDSPKQKSQLRKGVCNLAFLIWFGLLEGLLPECYFQETLSKGLLELGNQLETISGWWLNQPIWTNMHVKLDHVPNFWGEDRKIYETTTQVLVSIKNLEGCAIQSKK